MRAHLDEWLVASRVIQLYIHANLDLGQHAWMTHMSTGTENWGGQTGGGSQ